MPIVNYTHGARVRVVGRIHGSETNSVLHFGTNVVPVDQDDWPAKLLLLAQAVAECFTTHLLPVLTSDWEFDRVHAKLWTPLEIDDQVDGQNANTVGAGTAQGMTIAAAIIQIRSGRDGRKGRGRMFLPPGGENHLNGGDWDPAFIAAAVAFCACMAGKFVGAGKTTDWALGVLSRKDFSSVGGTHSNSFREAMQLLPVEQAGSLRTRKVGRGS